MQQVITISPDGTISGLQRKPGQGIDLRKFGPCVVERASDIRATDDGQRWTVNLLTGPYAGQQLDLSLASRAGLFAREPEGLDANLAAGGVLTFEDYDAAVRAEIATLDGLRRIGEF